MIAPLFALLLPSLIAPAPAVRDADHAALHPKDAVYYLEVPDLPSLLAGYGQAPLLTMLADGGVHESLAPFGVEGSSLDLGRGLKGLMTQLMGAENVPLVADIRALSLSVTFDVARPEETMGLELVIDYPSAEVAAKADGMVKSMHSGGDGGLTIPIGDQALPGWSLADGSRLVLGGGVVTMDQVKSRQQGGDSLQADAVRAKTNDGIARGNAGKWGEESGLIVARGFMRTSAAAAAAASGEMPEAFGSLLGALEPFPGPTSWRMRLDNGRFVSDSFSATSADAKILGVQPLDRAWLELVPQDVMLAYGGSLDAKAFARMLEKALGDTQAAELDDAAKEALTVFEKVGPSMVFYSHPIAGIGLPKAFLWAELQETEGFQEALSGAIGALGADQGIQVSTRDYKVKDAASGERIPIPITTIKLPAEMTEGAPISISPSFTVLDGKLLGSLSAVHIKRELKRLHEGDEAQSSAMNPVAACGVALPEDARSVMLMDWGSLIDGLFGLAKAFGGMAAMAAGEGGLPFDINQLPPPETFTRFFRPTVHYSRRVEGGLYRFHEASFGPETWAGLGAGGFFAYQQVMASGMLGGGAPMGGR